MALVEVARFYDPWLGQIARSKLEAYDIPCFLQDVQANTVIPLYQTALGGVRLAVPQARYEDALILLAEETPNIKLESDEEPYDPPPPSYLDWLLSIAITAISGIPTPFRKDKK